MVGQWAGLITHLQDSKSIFRNLDLRGVEFGCLSLLALVRTEELKPDVARKFGVALEGGMRSRTGDRPSPLVPGLSLVPFSRAIFRSIALLIGGFTRSGFVRMRHMDQTACVLALDSERGHQGALHVPFFNWKYRRPDLHRAALACMASVSNLPQSSVEGY
jgi:hypothetical protein